MVVQRLWIRAAGNGDFASVRLHPNGKGRFKLSFGNAVRAHLSVDGHLNAAQARRPAVVVDEEIVAPSGHAAVRCGLLEFVVIVHEVNVVPEVGGERIVKRHAQSNVIERVVSNDFDEQGAFVVPTYGNRHAGAVVVCGIRVEVQRLGVCAAVDGLFRAITVPNHPSVHAFCLAGIVERDRFASEVVVRTHRIVDIVTFARVEARPIVCVGVGVVVQCFLVGATVDRQVGAISKEGHPRTCTHGFAFIGEGHVVSGDVVVRAHWLIDVFTFTIVHA